MSIHRKTRLKTRRVTPTTAEGEKKGGGDKRVPGNREKPEEQSVIAGKREEERNFSGNGKWARRRRELRHNLEAWMGFARELFERCLCMVCRHWTKVKKKNWLKMNYG